MRPLETCIECKVREARHWRSNFCEDCFREILNSKLEDDDDIESHKVVKNR